MQRKTWLLILMVAGLLMVNSAWVSAQDTTPEATASAPLVLSRHYVSANERVAFSYPKGWVFDLRTARDGYFLDGRLGSSQEVLDKDLGTFGDGLDSGEVYMELVIARFTTLTENFPDVTADTSVVEVLQMIFDNSPQDFTLSEVIPLEVGGKTAARLDVHTKKGAGGFILLMEFGNGVIGGLSVGAPGGELPQWEPTILAIAESMTFVAAPETTPEATAESTPGIVPELTQTMKSENSSVVVSYPENWVARSPNNNEVDIAPDQDSLDLSFGDQISSGQVKILIQIDTTKNLISNMRLPLEDNASVEKILQAAVKAASSAGSVEFTPVTSTVVDDEPAAFTQFSGPGFEGLAWVAEHDTFARMLIQVVAAPGEAEQWKDLALAVAEAATYPG
ncbi:MAG: hypothetical protein ABI690_12760 [Chloroflexota bacterium]